MEAIVLAIIGLVVALGGEWIRRIDKSRTERLTFVEEQLKTIKGEYGELKTESRAQEDRLMARIGELEGKVEYWMHKYFDLMERSVKKQVDISEKQVELVAEQINQSHE